MMKNIFSLISRSGNPEKKKLILNFTMLLGYFLISMITFFSISPVYAARPIFRIGIETIAYPSESPLTKIADVDVLQSVKQMKKAGFSNDVNEVRKKMMDKRMQKLIELQKKNPLSAIKE